MTLKNNRAPLLCYYMYKLCASFCSHQWIKLELRPGNAQVGTKSAIFLSPVTLITLKDNRAPLLSYFKLCASFRSHLCIQTGVTVRKRPNWGKICFDLCDLDLWPSPFAWASRLSMVITLKNFRIRWQEHCQKAWQTDGWTDGKMCSKSCLVAAKDRFWWSYWSRCCNHIKRSSSTMEVFMVTIVILLGTVVRDIRSPTYYVGVNTLKLKSQTYARQHTMSGLTHWSWGHRHTLTNILCWG